MLKEIIDILLLELYFDLVWLEWNIYANPVSLYVFILVNYAYYCHTTILDNRKLIGTIFSVFMGYCMWIIWCIVNYGHAVG